MDVVYECIEWECEGGASVKRGRAYQVRDNGTNRGGGERRVMSARDGIVRAKEDGAFAREDCGEGACSIKDKRGEQVTKASP